MLARGHALVCTSFEVSSHGAAEYRTPQLIPTKIDRHRSSHAVPTGLSLYLSSLPTPFAQLCRFMSSGWGGGGGGGGGWTLTFSDTTGSLSCSPS